MHSKTITVTSQVPNTITGLSISVAPRRGYNPRTVEADGFIHNEWGSLHDVELDKPITVTYGDDQNPYIDAVLVSYTPSGSRKAQRIFGVGGVRGSEEDKALNMYDTFLIKLVKSDGEISSLTSVMAVMECKNSNGSGDTVTFPR